MTTKFKRFEIDICEGCLKMEGEMCHEPGCDFIRMTTPEIKDLLSQLSIKFTIKLDNGKTEEYNQPHVMEYTIDD